MSSETGEPGSDDLKLIAFEVGGQRHGLISTAVCEVLHAVTLTPISGVSRLVEGGSSMFVEAFCQSSMCVSGLDWRLDRWNRPTT